MESTLVLCTPAFQSFSQHSLPITLLLCYTGLDTQEYEADWTLQVQELTEKPLAKSAETCYTAISNETLHSLVESRRTMTQGDEELLDANAACAYLAKRWGVSSYSLLAFRSLRHRHKIKPALAAKTATFWRKSDLDKIPKPSRSNPRPDQRKKRDDEPGGTATVQPWDLPVAELARAG